MAKLRQKHPGGTGVNWADPLASKLRLFLPMSEGAGRNVASAASGNPSSPNNNGRFYGTTMTWANGQVGPHLVMPGSNAHYLIVDKFRWSANVAGSFSVWFHATTGQNQALYGTSQTGATDPFRLLGPWSDNNLYWDYGDSVGAGRLVAAFPTTLYNTWVHVVGVSAGVNGNFKALYINGVLAASASTSGGPTIATEFLSIGAWHTNGWTGRIANFAIWERVLTQTEVRRLYNDPYGLILPPRKRLIYVGGLALPVTGTAAFTTGAASLDATGHISISGSVALTTGSASLAATGRISLTGTAAFTTGSAVLAATGTVVAPTANSGKLLLLGIG